MSMPSSTIRCSGCNYEKIDLCAPISLVYRSEDSREATVPRSMGWCYSCDDYVYIENVQKSDLLGMQDGWRMLNLSAQADKLQMLIDYAGSRKSKMSCLECWSKDTVPMEVDISEIEQLTAERESLVIEYASPRQKRVLELGLDGNTEIQRQAYLQKVEVESPFFVGNKHEKFFKKIDEALKRAETHHKFRNFKHKCGGDLLRINDGAIRANISPKQFVLDLEGYLIEERQPELQI
jgi:hypothetical protein